MTGPAGTVYLDSNATTPCAPEVVAEMLPYFTERFANPSAMHGLTVAPALRRAREQVRALLGAARESEIVFTSGGTEADTTAIYSAVRANPGRREIVTSAVEHPAVLAVCEALRQREGYRVHVVGVDRAGRIDLDGYRQALSDRVALVSVMWANNETGTLFPIEHLARLAKPYGAVFHTDAVQAVGKIPLRLSNSAIDMLSLSGHKLHGPKGIGALYVRHGLDFQSLLLGGHQERGRRAGTENVPGIVGLGKAAALSLAALIEENTRVRCLRDRLERSVLAAVPGAAVLGDPEQRLPNTATFAFDYVDAEGVLVKLSRAGVVASSGAACASGATEPSHVLRAMDVPSAALYGAVRFSLSRDTRDADVERAAAVIPGIVAGLRGQPPAAAPKERETASLRPVYQ